jgi:hypothetical protein
MIRVEMLSTKPFSIEPMLCECAELPPEGHEWRYELKLDVLPFAAGGFEVVLCSPN